MFKQSMELLSTLGCGLGVCKELGDDKALWFYIEWMNVSEFVERSVVNICGDCVCVCVCVCVHALSC